MSRAALTDAKLMAEVTKGLEDGNLSPHYRHLAMKAGYVRFLAFRRPGQRGRKKLISVLTEKGEKFLAQHQAEVMAELKAAA